MKEKLISLAKLQSLLKKLNIKWEPDDILVYSNRGNRIQGWLPSGKLFAQGRGYLFFDINSDDDIQVMYLDGAWGSGEVKAKGLKFEITKWGQTKIKKQEITEATITPQQRVQLKKGLEQRTKARRRKEDLRRQHVYK